MDFVNPVNRAKPNSSGPAQQDSLAGKEVNVVYLGLDYFPFGLAETQRVRLISKGLIYHGCRVTVLSRWWGGTQWREAELMSAEGFFEGIRYVNASGTLTRPESWLRRKGLRLRGLLYEPLCLRKLHKQIPLDAGIVSSGSFLDVAYYGILAKFIGFPLLLNSVELHSAATRGDGLSRRLNAILRDRLSYYFVDGVLPISEVLRSRAVASAPRKPVLKVPVLVDNNRYCEVRRNSPDRRYILFCGYLIYLEVVEFILDVFDTLRSDDVSLYLVLNGSSDQFESFNRRLARSQRRNSIKVFTKLPDKDLSVLYVNAFALLIPLRPTRQDEARFPHKIGEYCASGRPIITTNVGEVPEYFRDGENAVVVPRYDVNEVADAIDRLLSQPEEADRIGKNGKELALREFDHLALGGRIKALISSLRK
jgi:glycosyltransferase involved in cell wall biosynthesis